MKRLIWLALLAMALPMAAFADSVTFLQSGILNSSGTLNGGATASYSGSISSGYTLNVPLIQFTDNNIVTATSGMVTLNTGALSATSSPWEYTFTGTVTITDSSSSVLFTSSVTSGTIIAQPNGSIVINGLLANGGINNILGRQVNGARLVTGGGNAVTGTSVVPEPGTLGLFGTGLVGIAGLVRRKVRMG